MYWYLYTEMVSPHPADTHWTWNWNTQQWLSSYSYLTSGRIMDNTIKKVKKDMQPEFTNYLNSRHPRIKFICSFSTQSVEFLDTKVYIEDNTLKTSLFIKPTSSLDYLQRSSCHPSMCFCHYLMVNFFGPEEIVWITHPTTNQPKSFLMLLSREAMMQPPLLRLC